MSIELPEACILARQMSRELQGKEIASCNLQGCEKLQKIGFVNENVCDFDKLCGGKIESVTSRGNVIRAKLDNGMNLILAPEYGGKVLYHPKESLVSPKFHLKLRFEDNTTLTIALAGMGVIKALKDAELEHCYVYRRDFSMTACPTDFSEFTFERFSKELNDEKVNIKSALVGKDAVIVGLSNSVFQDILYRAGVHPKRKASDLLESEKQALYDAINSVVQERIKSGGKNQFTDLYGKQGRYAPPMGPNMKGKACPACGTQVENLSIGGGQAYYCPKCQN